MKKIALLLFGMAAALTACNNDSNDDAVYMTLGFESGTAGYLAGPTSYGENLYSKNLAEEPYDPSKLENGEDYPLFTSYHDDATDLEFGINESGGDYLFSSGGIAISQWHDQSVNDYLNQCSVYGSGGHANSGTFAVVYYSAYNPAPSVEFKTAATERRFESVWITNTTYGVLTMKNGNKYVPEPLENNQGWLLLTIEGFDAAGVSKGKETLYLADFRTAGSPGIVTDWTKVNLSSLGNVHKLTFTVTGSDMGQFGLNTPSYFCFDNLTFRL